MIEDKILEVEAPPSVEVSLMEKDGKLLLHLVNWHGEKVMTGRAISEYIPSLSNIKVKIKLEDEPKRVTELPSNNKVKYIYKEKFLTFSITKLELHTIICIE